MASVVIDELISKIEYDANPDVLRVAEQAAKALEQQNKATAEAADKLSTEQRKLAEHTDVLTESQNDYADQLAETTAETARLKDEQRAIQAEVKKTGKATDEQTARLAELDRGIKANEHHTRELRQENARVGREKAKTAQESRKLSRAQKDLANQSRETAQQQRKLADAVHEAKNAASQGSSMLSGLTEKISTLASGQLAADAIKAIGMAVYELGKEIIVTGANFESLRARLKTVEGSTEAAGDAFRTIQDFAKATPFEVENVTTAFVQLRVRGINPTNEKLTALGDLTSAFGYSFQEMTDAIGAAARGELDPIEKFGIAAKVTGDKIKLSFRGQTEVVERSADAVTNVLVKWGQMNGIQGAMAEQSATTAGMFSNLKDGISALFDTIAQMGVLDEVKLLMQELGASMGGDDGLAHVIADVLVIALRTVRELFTAMPQETLINFLQQLVSVIGMVVGTLVDMATGNAGMVSALYDFLAAIISVIGTIYSFVQRVQEIKEAIGGIPGPLDMLMKGLQLLAKMWEWAGKKLEYVMTLLGPFLDKLRNIADRLPSFNDLFSTLGAKLQDIGSAVNDLTGGFFSLNNELAQTKSAANLAREALEKLEAQNDYKKKSTAELTELRQAGDEKADAELARRRDANTASEKAEEADKKKKEEAAATGKKLDRLLDNPGRLTDKQLASIAAGDGMQGIDAKDAQKLRDKAQKEIDKRANKRTKDGKTAGEKLNKSLLTHDIDKQFDELAKAAGKRAAARALQRGGGRLSEEDINDIELNERKAVKARLASRYEQTGELPPGMAMDLVQTAALPNIEQTGGRLAPPVITVTNWKVEITGNTFEAIVQVQGGVSATPQSIAHAVVSQAQPVTHQSLAMAIQNQLTNERR